MQKGKQSMFTSKARVVVAVCVLCVLAPCQKTAGREIYVNNLTGDDRCSGAQSLATPDLTGPVRTIARALQLANGGDRIILAATGQPYRESISIVGLRLSGTRQRPLVIEGNGAVLDGSSPVPPEAWEHYRGAIFRFRPTRKAWQQLFLDGKPPVRVPVPPGRTVTELDALQWCLVDGWLYFCVENDKLPADYNLSCATLQTGITLYQVENVAILDLTVQGFQQDGINVFNNARGVYLAGVISRGNGRSGITVGGASSAVIEACLLGNNGKAQLLTLPYCEVRIINSYLLGNTAPGWVDRGGSVYWNGQQIRGGRDELQPPETPQQNQADQQSNQQ